MHTTSKPDVKAASAALATLHRTVTDSGSTGPLHTVAALVKLQELTRYDLTDAVRQARREGCTWEVIAAALGVTHSAAIQRYKDRI